MLNMIFLSRPLPKADRELQTALNRIRDKGGPLAGRWAVSLHRDCVLIKDITIKYIFNAKCNINSNLPLVHYMFSTLKPS